MGVEDTIYTFEELVDDISQLAMHDNAMIYIAASTAEVAGYHDSLGGIKEAMFNAGRGIYYTIEPIFDSEGARIIDCPVLEGFFPRTLMRVNCQFKYGGKYHFEEALQRALRYCINNHWSSVLTHAGGREILAAHTPTFSFD